MSRVTPVRIRVGVRPTRPYEVEAGAAAPQDLSARQCPLSLNEWADGCLFTGAVRPRARRPSSEHARSPLGGARPHCVGKTRRRSSLAAAAAAAATATAGCRLPAAGCRLPAAGCCRLTADGCGERRRLGSRSLREGATEPAALDLGATRRQVERRSARPLRGDA